MLELSRKGPKPRQAPASLDELYDRCIPIPFSGCWVWDGATTVGYGVIRFGQRNYLTHRLAYELVKGPIPAGLEIDHLCRVPGCLNPDHLEAVTRRVNAIRGIGPRLSSNPERLKPLREARRAYFETRTHCKRGHALTADNIYTDPTTGERACRECRRMRGRLREQAKKAARRKQ